MKEEISTDNKKYLKQVGERVKQLRKSRTNLSYSDFAEKVELHRNTYFRIESGSHDFHITTLKKILDHYHITMSDFFKELEE